MSHIEQVKEMIHVLLRQADSDALPVVFKPTRAIAALVDQATAQRLYREVAAEIETESGIKFEWVA